MTKSFLILSACLVSSSAIAAAPVEYSIKPGLDPFVRDGYLSSQSVEITKAVIRDNGALGRKCIQAKIQTEDAPGERYTFELSSGGGRTEIRLIAMGVLRLQTLTGTPKLTSKFGKPGTPEFKYACGDSYISSTKLGGQLVITTTIRTQTDLPSSRIVAHSAQEARQLIAPAIEQALHAGEWTGGRVDVDDPRSAALFVAPIMDLTMTVDRAVDYVEGLHRTPSKDLILLKPLSILVNEY